MEVTNYSYETLSPLIPSPSSSAAENTTTTTTTAAVVGEEAFDDYVVFSNHISLNSPETTAIDDAAVNFFSLAVDNSNNTSDELSRAKSVAAEREKNKEVEPEVGRTLEQGWFRSDCRFKSPMLQLHKEILDFCDFLSPTPEEGRSRDAAIQRVSDVIKYIWPSCRVEVFGSYRTGLYLPSSDIDVVILESNIRSPQIGLQALSRALSQKGIAKKIQGHQEHQKVEVVFSLVCLYCWILPNLSRHPFIKYCLVYVIGKARVPIIKFVEKVTDVAFDLSFDVDNGPKAAEYIKDVVSSLPPLRPLCLILKVFLQQRELNEVYSGGIGSYALLAMLIAMLKSVNDGQRYPEHNLGVLLVKFFEFYAHKLNTWDVGVSCNGRGTFFLKSKKGFQQNGRPFLICIQDPQAPENDIGKSSYNYFQIRSAFMMAYASLTNTKAIMNLGPDRSILGTIIRPDAVLLERKGGSTGNLTFNSLLPGAGEIVDSEYDEKQDLMCNWRLDTNYEEEPLPRGGDGGSVDVNGGSSPGKKRKASRVKTPAKAKENGSSGKAEYHENGSRKDWKKEKKRSKFS
ncbi:hypothetical protein RND81_12G233500 [Saponaria officinalis]|uniref:Uncharacterized protein n=1 Tax=Saponaria officinalis TaxID=3572 RepID=A0AAW1HEH0_SAPOF